MTDAEKAELAELDAQIAAERAALAEIHARRTPSELEQKKAELAAAKREREDTATIEQLEKVHGKLGEKIGSVGTPLGMIVVKAPTRQAFKEYNDAAKGGAMPFDHQDTFVKRCIIHPEKAAASQMLLELPALMTPLANLCSKLGGFKDADLQGK